MLNQRLKRLERQIIVFYLEGLVANSVAENHRPVAGKHAMKVHRIKNIMRRSFGEAGTHGT